MAMAGAGRAGVPAGEAAGILAAVVACTAAGAAVDAFRWRKGKGQQGADSGPRFWVMGMLISSYSLLVPGLISHLFTAKTDLFGMQTVSEYDETTVSLVHRLVHDNMVLGAILVTLYAMVVPVLKLVLLVLCAFLKRGSPASQRWARRCLLVVQAVSKWASPDMFAYILLMYLIRGLNKPPVVNSHMDLGLGFTCFCVFCVGSTVSSLGIRVPPALEAEGAPADASPQRAIPRWLAVVLLVALAAGFLGLLVVGLRRPSMSLHLDMHLLYEVRPDLRAMRSLLDPMDLPAMLRMEVGVWACLGKLCQWVAEGEVNCLIALVLYAGFAVLLPILDMALLLAAALLGPGRGDRAAALLSASRKVRKLAMLDVSIMGCFVVTMSLRSMRSNGVIVELCGGVGFLLGAEVCHYAAAFVARRAIMVGRGAGAASGKAFEKPQPSECSLESMTTADTLESVESQDVEQGTAREGAPTGADGNAFGV